MNNGNGRRLGIEHYELSRRQHRTIISPLFPTQNIAMAVRVCIEDISCNMMIENMFSNLGFFVCFCTYVEDLQFESMCACFCFTSEIDHIIPS